MAIIESSSRTPNLPPVQPRANEVVDAEGAQNASTRSTDPRAVGTPVEIAEVMDKFGWESGGWQEQLLTAADEMAGGDGEITAAELDGYLDAPEGTAFISSTAMGEQRDELAAALDEGDVGVDGFDSEWQNQLAQRADALGNEDGTLTEEELNTFLDEVKANGGGELPTWLPDQKGAMMRSRLAELTNEVDHLDLGGESVRGTELIKEYMRLSVDAELHVPEWVSYQVTAADIREQPVTVDRTESSFLQDTEIPNGATEGDYSNTGYDRGHMKPAETSPSQEAMDESHLMTNVAPQAPDMNRQTWRTLEKAVHELVQATGGEAHIVTGSLFLDESGKPIDPTTADTIGTKNRDIALPTHSFKTVLLEEPGGKLTMFSYMVPNDLNSPTKKDEIGEWLTESRVSTDEIEELLGRDLFEGLPQDVQDRLEADPAQRVEFENASEYHRASLLWPQDEPTTDAA